MVNYFDIPSQVPVARTRFSIPDWVDFISVYDEWGPYDISTYIDPEYQKIIIEMRYAHRGGRCYRIEDYCVYDWRVTVWIGTVTYRLRVDQARLRRKMRDAELLLYRITRDALVDYIDPTSGAEGGAIDIGIAFANLPIPQIFGDLAGVVDLTQLLAKVSEIAENTERVMRELERIRRLDGQIVARFDNIRCEKEGQQIKTFSSIEIKEVQCAQWILDIPEGETIRVPGHDQWIYPVGREDLGRALDKGKTRDRAIAEDDELASDVPRGARDIIKQLRPHHPAAPGAPPIPEEIGRDR